MLEAEVPVYRYVVTDLLTGTLLAEIPFKDVSYGRVLRRAGEFSGSVAFIPENAHLKLYENTLPGKTALYVLRNNVCVWGGIIWGRSYDSISKTLSVDAAEMVSYLYHRYVWQTLIYSSTPITIVKYSISGGVATVTTANRHGFLANDPVIIKNTATAINGKQTITSVTDYTFQFNTAASNTPDTTTPVTAYCKYFLDTYDVTRNLLARMSNDFDGIKFENDYVAPYTSTKYGVASYSVSGGILTVNLDAESDPVDFIAGQAVTARELLGSPYDDSTYKVLTVATGGMSFTASTTHTNLALTSASPFRYLEAFSKEMTMLTAPVGGVTSIGKIVTKSAHGLSAGDIVEIFLGDGFFDGIRTVLATPDSTTFTFERSEPIFASIPATQVEGTRYITAGTFITGGTYGPYTLQANIDGFDVNTLADSGLDQDSQTYRGYELKSIGDILETYSNNLNGFEYRIDSNFDTLNNRFDNIFTFIARDLPNPPAEGDVSPISRFGVEDLVFQYPGNIQSFSVEESAENAATRMWVVGNQEGLDGEASQPYAAIANTEYLDNGWPLLDQMETESSSSTQTKLEGLAAEYLTESLPPIGNIKIKVNGSLEPSVGTFKPGDWVALLFLDTTSPTDATDQFMKERLESNQELRDNVLVRKVVSYTVNVPNMAAAFPEMVDIELIEDWQVDRRGD